MLDIWLAVIIPVDESTLKPVSAPVPIEAFMSKAECDAFWQSRLQVNGFRTADKYDTRIGTTQTRSYFSTCVRASEATT